VTTAADIVNRALQEIAAQATVTGVNPTFDGSAAGNAAGILYNGVVATILREQDWEFARREGIGLTLTGNPPLAGWGFEYAYPSDCIRLLQVMPSTFTPNDPQPVRWSVGEDVVSGSPAKVILTDQASAGATYISNTMPETLWDSIFTEAVVRMLASELAMALGGRPDFSEKMLQISGGLVQSGGGKDS
jgi:hypothetical protein